MEHDHIMARLDDRKMEVRIQLRFFLRCVFVMRSLHLLKDGIDHIQIGLRAEFCGALCGKSFHISAKGEVVEHRIIMAREKAGQGR